MNSLSHGQVSYPTTPSAWQKTLPDGHGMLKPSVHVSLCLDETRGGSWLLHRVHHDSKKSFNETSNFSLYQNCFE